MSSVQGDVEESPYGCGHLVGSTLCSVAYEEGYAAGYRGDELVEDKLLCYLAGYESGQTAREEKTREMELIEKRAGGIGG